MNFLILTLFMAVNSLATEIPQEWLPYQGKLTARVPTKEIKIPSTEYDENIAGILRVRKSDPERFALLKKQMEKYVIDTKAPAKEINPLKITELCEALNSQKMSGYPFYQNNERDMAEMILNYEATSDFAKKLETRIDQSQELLNCAQSSFLQLLAFTNYKNLLELFRQLKADLPSVKPGKRLATNDLYRLIKDGLIFDFWRNQDISNEIVAGFDAGKTDLIPGMALADKDLAKKAFDQKEYTGWMVKLTQFEIAESAKLKTGQDVKITGKFPEGVPTLDEISKNMQEVKALKNNQAEVEKYVLKHKNIMGKAMLPFSAKVSMKDGKIRSRTLENWNSALRDFNW